MLSFSAGSVRESIRESKSREKRPGKLSGKDWLPSVSWAAYGVKETTVDDNTEPALQKPLDGNAVVVEHMTMTVNPHDPHLNYH